MRITLTSIGSLQNRGVEALAVTSIEGFRRVFLDPKITVLTHHRIVNELLLDASQATLCDDPYRNRRIRILRRLGPLQHLLWPLRGVAVVQLERHLACQDLVIASGGDNFSSDYGSPAVWLHPLRHAERCGVPVVFMAQSIGPFRNEAHRSAFVPVAERAKLLSVRERASYDYVTKDLGISSSRVVLTADPAFLLNPASASWVEKALAHYGIDPLRPKVAISVSQGISRYAKVDEKAHLAKLTAVIKMVLEDFDAQVILVPHVRSPRPRGNDFLLAEQLLRQHQFDRRIFLLQADHTAREFKGIIGACDLVVAERMHAAIAGMSSGICTVVIGYSVKGHGIVSDALGVDSLAEGLVIPVDEFVKTERGLNLISAAWNRRHEIAGRLRESLPAVRARAERNFTLLTSLRH